MTWTLPRVAASRARGARASALVAARAAASPIARLARRLGRLGQIAGRRGQQRPVEDRLRSDVALERVDRLHVAGVRVVRAAEVVEHLGPARDERRVLGQRLQIVDGVVVELGLVLEESAQQREVLAEARPQRLGPLVQDRRRRSRSVARRRQRARSAGTRPRRASTSAGCAAASFAGTTGGASPSPGASGISGSRSSRVDTRSSSRRACLRLGRRRPRPRRAGSTARPRATCRARAGCAPSCPALALAVGLRRSR